MKINDIKSVLSYLFEANITPMLIGRHGIGKSQILKQFCEKEKYHFVDLRLGTQDVGDLIGLADFDTDKNGKKIATRFIPPDWLKNSVDFALANPESKAIIFLDEINRGHRDVLQAIFSLVLDKRMHQIQLPKNVHTVAAMNPSTDDYVTTDLSDKALIDRFCHINVEPTVKEWLDFASENNFDSDIINFISEQRKLLDSKTENFDLQFVKPSRRSWDAIQRLKRTEIPNDLFMQACMGIVGVAATSALQAFLKDSDKPLQAEFILNDYKKYQNSVKKYSNPDTETQGRLDLLTNACENLERYFEKNKEDLTKKQKTNFENFLIDIPLEVSLPFCQKFVTSSIDTREWFKDFNKLFDHIKELKGNKTTDEVLNKDTDKKTK